MLNSKQYDTHSITYVGIDWALEDTFLVCKDVFIRSLFKADPKKLYINWAAALQIQFHVNNLDQSFSGTAEEWCREYLKNFVGQAKNRSNYMNEKYVKPFTELEEGSDPIVKG
jgi:type II restriction enzyme